MANTRRRRKKSGRRRGKQGCLSTVLFAILFLVALFAAITVFFKIKFIKVVGAEHYRTDEIIAASDIKTDTNLIFINKFSGVRKIFAALPYVSEVKISRDLPDTLVIRVVESRAAAYFRVGRDIWLVDARAKLLEKVSAPSTGIIEIVGVSPLEPSVGETVKAEDEEKLITLKTALALFEEKSMTSAVSRLDISGVYDISFSYLGRFEVKLGMPEDLEYKLDFLGRVIAGLSPEDEGIIDMSGLISTGEVFFTPTK